MAAIGVYIMTAPETEKSGTRILHETRYARDVSLQISHIQPTWRFGPCLWWLLPHSRTYQKLIMCYIEFHTAAFVGENSITCITFDKLDWEGEPIASNGVWMNNFNVMLKPAGGMDGNSGDFRPPSKLEFPYLTGNDF
ncbi:hypothetical protein LSAT2_010052, partial [Lamellibrachia satsuma]